MSMKKKNRENHGKIYEGKMEIPCHEKKAKNQSSIIRSNLFIEYFTKQRDKNKEWIEVKNKIISNRKPLNAIPYSFE